MKRKLGLREKEMMIWKRREREDGKKDGFCVCERERERGERNRMEMNRLRACRALRKEKRKGLGLWLCAEEESFLAPKGE